MPIHDDEYLKISIFANIARKQQDQIHELTVMMVALRTALMNLKPEDLPLSAEYLKQIEANVRKAPQLIQAREGLEKARTAEELFDLLQSPKGLIQ